MERKYFVWKDPACNGVRPEWVELSAREFYLLRREPQNRSRRFVMLDDGGCADACVLVMEATEEAYRDWHRDSKAASRRAKTNAGYDLTLSLDQPLPDADEVTLHELVPADLEPVEDQALHNLDLCRLKHILNKLSDEELVCLNALYMDNRHSRSEREIARRSGASQSTVNWRKKKILEKLKKVLVKIDFLGE